MSTSISHEVTLLKSQKESYQYLRDNLAELMEKHCDNIRKVTNTVRTLENDVCHIERITQSNSYLPDNIIDSLPQAILDALLLFDDHSDWNEKTMVCDFVFKPRGLEIYLLKGHFDFESIPNEPNKSIYRLKLEISTNVDNIKSQMYLIPDIILDPTINTISSLINQEVLNMARTNMIDMTKDIQDV